MKTKTYVEENKTINIISNNNDNVIVEVYDYTQGVDRFYVDLTYYHYDFNVVLLLYKEGKLFI